VHRTVQLLDLHDPSGWQPVQHRPLLRGVDGRDPPAESLDADARHPRRAATDPPDADPL